MSHLHKLVQAARVSADANDVAQVKKYLDQMNEFADNLENREKALKQSQEQSNKAAKSTGGGASGSSETSRSDDPQKK